MTKTLAQEAATHGVRVRALGPGAASYPEGGMWINSYAYEEAFGE
jgi:NAD(P)-dependent dehydrogenase (short-subunit alcohol dehydrogenase family)